MTRSRAIATAFGRAASTYDDHAELQRHVAARLAALIGELGIRPGARVLEIGCGTGLLTEMLSAGLPGSSIIATDVAVSMVRACRARVETGAAYVVMDGTRPCLAGPRFDLVCASLAFQWFEDLPAGLLVLRGLLAGGGRIAFSTLGPGSLAAWRESHRREGLPLPPAPYPDPDAIAAAWPGHARLIRTRLSIPYSNGLGFLRMLRGLGADVPGRGQSPLSPGALRRVMARFERDFQARADYDLVFAVLSDRLET